jgi:hypothetical protein
VYRSNILGAHGWLVPTCAETLNLYYGVVRRIFLRHLQYIQNQHTGYRGTDGGHLIAAKAADTHVGTALMIPAFAAITRGLYYDKEPAQSENASWGSPECIA